MLHFVYKTVNNINKKYYIGVHSSEKEDDGYIGSGKRLRQSVKKYGKENFTRIILQYFDTKKEALDYERAMVNETTISDEKCYNIAVGGGGGLLREENGMHGVHRFGEDNPFFGHHHSEDTKLIIKEKRAKQIFSEETRRKMGESKSGENNPMFGKTHNTLARDKIRKANIGRTASEATRKKMSASRRGRSSRICVTIDGITYPSIRNAAAELNTTCRLIKKIIANKT